MVVESNILPQVSTDLRSERVQPLHREGHKGKGP